MNACSNCYIDVWYIAAVKNTSHHQQWVECVADAGDRFQYVTSQYRCVWFVDRWAQCIDKTGRSVESADNVTTTHRVSFRITHTQAALFIYSGLGRSS